MILFIEFINEFNKFFKIIWNSKINLSIKKKRKKEENRYTMSHDFTIYPIHNYLKKKNIK